MDEAQAKERILESENLTDALEDDDANWLLDWGAKQVGPLIRGIADDEQAGNKVNELMATMRMLNQTVGDRPATNPKVLADDVRQFVERYNAAFGTSVSLSDVQIATLAQHVAALDPHDAMQVLLDSVAQPGTPGTPAPAAPPSAAAAERPEEASPPPADGEHQTAEPGDAAQPPTQPTRATPGTPQPGDGGQQPAQPSSPALAAPPKADEQPAPAHPEHPGAEPNATQQGDAQSDAASQEDSHA
jgi:hypothetical protein